MQFATKLETGQVLGSRYRIIQLIGAGGMSRVYMADDLRLPGKRWAVKESISLGSSYGDIQAEAEILLSLNHPLLPRVTDFFQPDSEGYSYLVMDYIEGQNLNQFINSNSGALSGAQILIMAKQLLQVLCYLHGQHPPIIYRDLKPSNVMLTASGSLVLIDFGIARNFKSGAGEDTEKLGTVGFAAPEQYGGMQSTPLSDLYGLGALLLYLATDGQYSQWQAGMENKLRAHIPDSFIPVIRRLLRHHPEERYPSAEAVLAALEPIEASAGHKASKLTTPAVTTSWDTAVVALLGVSSGLGTTHTSFAVSSVLARSGLTAWVDLSPDSTAYPRIYHLLQGSEESRDIISGGAATPLRWKGVHFWKRPQNGNLAEIMALNYSYVVLDLGTGQYEGALEQFAASRLPVLIASGAEWRLEDLMIWLRSSGLVPQRNWRIGLPLAGIHAAELLGALVEPGTVEILPFQQDPFRPKGKLALALRKLLSELTSIQKPANRSGIFQKKH